MACAASIRLVPAGTPTSVPLIVSLGMRDQRLELIAELLDVRDIRADGAVVEGADRGAGAALGHVEDLVEVVLLAAALDDPPAPFVDPAGGLATRLALAARLVGVDAPAHPDAPRGAPPPLHPHDPPP